MEEIGRTGTWLAELAEDWRVATAITDFGGSRRAASPDPPGGAWFLGTGQGCAVIEYRR